MQLRDVMTSNVEVVRPGASLQEAAALMRDLDVGALPVCDGTRLQGMVTDRDITIRATATGRDPRQTPVSEVMTSDLIYCFEDQHVEEAALFMKEHQIRRLPILSRQKDLVGIVSLGDLAVDTGDEELVGEVLEEVSEPAQTQRR